MVKRLVCSMQMFSSPSSPSLNQLSTKTLISNLERRSGYLHCLQCFGKTLLGDEGILGLESNTFLCSAADRLASQLNTCADCDKQKTSVYCEDCELYLCQTCASRIHSGTKTSRHKVHDLNNDGRSVDSPQSNVRFLSLKLLNFSAAQLTIKKNAYCTARLAKHWCVYIVHMAGTRIIQCR